jgi:serine protease AprX
LTGQGIGVAVLDTGCFPHEDLVDRIVCFRDMVGRHTVRPYDDNGHGTHVCGIIAGEKYGIAPGCSLIPIKVLDHRGNGFASDVLAGLRYIREQRAKYNIRIVNISVGSFSRRNMSENSALVRGVNEAWDEGLIVVVAAGNMGPGSGTITTPGISRKVITVGCSDDEQEVNVMGNHMVNYSGRGPTSSCICKPDIIAPGASITSCSNYPHTYATKSGTSMSTPIVSAALALLLEKHPTMTNRDVKLHLRSHSQDLGLPHNRQGWGLLNLQLLLR